jgi:hypothetical protein
MNDIWGGVRGIESNKKSLGNPDRLREDAFMSLRDKSGLPGLIESNSGMPRNLSVRSNMFVDTIPKKFTQTEQKKQLPCQHRDKKQKQCYRG